MRLSEGVSVGFNIALCVFVVAFALIAPAAIVILGLSVIAPFPH